MLSSYRLVFLLSIPEIKALLQEKYTQILTDVITYMGFPGGPVVKNLPPMQETLVRSLGWEYSLEKEKAIPSGILAWEIPWMEKPGGLMSRGCKELDMT